MGTHGRCWPCRLHQDPTWSACTEDRLGSALERGMQASLLQELVQVQEEGLHQGQHEVEGRDRQEGNREGFGSDQEILRGREADCPHPAEALAQEAKESPHHGDPAERWVRRRQGRLRLRNVREDHPHHGRLRQERDDRLGRRHQGKRLQGRHFQVAHQETSKEDAQGSSQGRLYRSLASFQDPVHCRPCWSEGIPPPYRDQQKNLRDQAWISQEGRSAHQGQRLHRVRYHRQVHQPYGRIPPLRNGQTGLCYDQGMLHWAQEKGSDLAQVSAGPYEEGCLGGYQAEVHRYFFQDGSRSLPDQGRQEPLHGTPQEGQSHRGSCFLNLSRFYFCLMQINFILKKKKRKK